MGASQFVLGRLSKKETKRAVYDDPANMGLGAGQGEPNGGATRSR